MWKHSAGPVPLDAIERWLGVCGSVFHETTNMQSIRGFGGVSGLRAHVRAEWSGEGHGADGAGRPRGSARRSGRVAGRTGSSAGTVAVASRGREREYGHV